MMGILEQIFWLLLLSIAVASVAWTVTQEEIFREQREYCKRRSENGRSLLERKFFYVFTCEYCFSHWVTLFFLIVTGFRLGIDDWRGYILAFFVIPWLANQWMSVYRRLRVEIKYENALAENEKNEGKK
jgi:hypothetical protein